MQYNYWYHFSCKNNCKHINNLRTGFRWGDRTACAHDPWNTWGWLVRVERERGADNATKNNLSGWSWGYRENVYHKRKMSCSKDPKESTNNRRCICCHFTVTNGMAYCAFHIQNPCSMRPNWCIPYICIFQRSRNTWGRSVDRDEIVMTHMHTIEAVGRMLQDLMKINLPFDGK